MATRFRSILTVEADRLLDGLDPDQRKAVTTKAENVAFENKVAALEKVAARLVDA